MESAVPTLQGSPPWSEALHETGCVSGASSPLLVEVTRSGGVESWHEVDAAIVDISYAVVSSWGEFGRPVLPRSAAKPLQALPLVTSGAADAFGLGNVELALACGSHDGEPLHVTAVEQWLHRINLTVDALACGVQRPLHDASMTALVAAGLEPNAVHNNCSGKHAGFLTVCRHLDLPVGDYQMSDHRLQVDHVTPALANWCGVDLAGQYPAVDGCGIPVWSLPLDRLAAGWASLGASTSEEPAGRLMGAMRSEPFHVAGSERACTRLIASCDGGVVVKTGAEGVFCAALPEDGMGLALKVRDGAHRAAVAAIEWLLTSLGRYDGEVGEMIENRTGTTVGEVRVADGGTRPDRS